MAAKPYRAPGVNGDELFEETDVEVQENGGQEAGADPHPTRELSFNLPSVSWIDGSE